MLIECLSFFLELPGQFKHTGPSQPQQAPVRTKQRVTVEDIEDPEEAMDSKLATHPMLLLIEIITYINRNHMICMYCAFY